MKERRGPLGRTVGAVAQGLAGAARRRQADREPRVVLYDGTGHATRLHAGTPEHDALVEVAEQLVDAAGGAGERGPEAGDETGEGAGERSPDAGDETAP